MSKDTNLAAEMEAAKEQVQEEKRRRSGLEAELEKKCHE